MPWPRRRASSAGIISRLSWPPFRRSTNAADYVPKYAKQALPPPPPPPPVAPPPPPPTVTPPQAPSALPRRAPGSHRPAASRPLSAPAPTATSGRPVYRGPFEPRAPRQAANPRSDS